ncbi:amino acid permease-domain-containing protein [Fomitopsis serialis]|uniref:amino acid permease-domain-containing protein n=1 Tax=Fomitopsis serialis TaxID=139415 RepID=UPI002008C9E4|nr:amino acid permease-domain-containing protein [Neoantrodia serialis]KAH9926198.1 amino acid permease-domain-containing protein [Neoantrodia serialis]
MSLESGVMLTCVVSRVLALKHSPLHCFFTPSTVAMQSNFDRRRINGPEESLAPVYDDEEEAESSWKPGQSRKGRAAGDIRPICMDAEDRSIAVQIQQALLPAVRLELLPKSTIDIFLTIIENDGIEGCIASGSVAASAALADAGIEMLGLVMACSASTVGEEIWLDPTEQEAQAGSGSLIVAGMPALDTITNSHVSSSSYKLAGRSPRASEDSDDSLRELEYSEGPLLADGASTSRARAYSISGFDFQADLLPLTASLSEPDTLRGESHPKNISLVSGIALIVGYNWLWHFLVTRVVVANTDSVGASLVVWLAAGLLGWTGASSFAELGSSIPVNGGAQAYLQYAYGPLVAYLFAWTAISALRPGGNAVISLIFAEYMNRLFFHTAKAEVSPDDIPQWAIKLTAVAAVLVVSVLCVASPNLGPRTAVVFTFVKVAALLSITILGIIQLARGRASTSLTEPLFAGSSTSPSSYALALYSGLWAFDGWDQANYVGGEMKNARKTYPAPSIPLLFLLANLAYFVVLDKDTVGRSNTVALDFGRALFGPVGGVPFALMVAISCFGALNGSSFTAARLIYVAGREGYLPAMFGRLNKRLGTPVNAMCLQATLTVLFIIIGGGFRSLINFAVVASWAFYFLTVLGLVVLRIKEPMLERPYKTWITTPLIFCAVCLFLLCMPIIAAPLEAIAVLGFVLVGIPMYYITQQSSVACFTGLFSRIRGRPTPGAGWEAVATEGDEQSIRFEMASHTYKFDVKMTCGGCSGAVERALKKANADGLGVESYDVSLEKQEVIVKGPIAYDTLLEKIKRRARRFARGRPSSDCNCVVWNSLYAVY